MFGKGLNRRAVIGSAAVAGCLGAGVLIAAGTAGRTAAMLRSDPDLIMTQSETARYAAAVAGPVFVRHCASCHGADMRGNRERGVPDLVDAEWLYGSGRPGEIERTILYGIRSDRPRARNFADMPAFGEAVPYRRYKVAPLKPNEIRDVVEFLRVLEREPADSSAAERGGRIFGDTGQCFDCHAADGSGDPAIGGPNLQDRIWLYGDGSRASVFNSIAHGHAGVCPGWFDRLQAGEVRALAIYISNAAKPPSAPGPTSGLDR